ncbi:hypothetical protein MSHRCOH1_09550 [Candidatus Ornithobacterium hominis]|nr:hypothetical protein MSHRCOH1_09550 [Candidatus Ornithobacterium hominis]
MTSGVVIILTEELHPGYKNLKCEDKQAVSKFEAALFFFLSQKIFQGLKNFYSPKDFQCHEQMLSSHIFLET